MVLGGLAILLLLSGFIARRPGLSAALKRRLVLIAVLTTVAVLALGSLRLGPMALLALLVGIGLGATQLMRERGAGAGFEDLSEGEAPFRPRKAGMDRAEALRVLGLEGDPDEESIRAAHKRMILRAHPDQGGSDYLAAKVNEARQVLLPKD